MEEITPQSPFWRTPGRRGEAPGPRRSRDPFVARVGAIVLLGVLAIPVVGSLRGGSDDATSADAAAVSPATGDGSIALIDPNAATTTIAAPATTASAATAATVPVPAAPTHAPATQPATTQDPVTTVAASTAAPSTAAQQQRADVLSATSATTPATEPSCSGEYEVGPGDYWIGIADRAGVSTSKLLDANGATTDTPIYPGSTICLPAGASDPGPPPAPSTTTTTAPATTAAPTTAQKPTTTTPAPTTTAKPSTTTAAPTTTQPKKTYSRSEVTAIITSVFPSEMLDTALKIAERESNLQPGVRNYCCFGLFQIHWEAHRSWLDDFGVTSPEQLYDPRVNAEMALALYMRSGGWGPWGGAPD